MTITEFLLARIEEDEKVARAAIRYGDGSWMAGEVLDEDGEVYDPCGVYGDDIHIYDEGGHDENHAEHIARHDPLRVLAECAAKRAIIRSHRSCIAAEDTTKDFGPRLVTSGIVKGLELAVKYLAGTYHTHPEYERDWADETIRSMRKHEVIPHYSDSGQEK